MKINVHHSLDTKGVDLRVYDRHITLKHVMVSMGPDAPRSTRYEEHRTAKYKVDGHVDLAHFPHHATVTEIGDDGERTVMGFVEQVRHSGLEHDLRSPKRTIITCGM